MKAQPLLLYQEKTQPGKLEGPDGSWGLFSQQLLPENGKKKKNNNNKKSQPVRKKSWHARGRQGGGGRPDGGSACVCLDGQ